MIKSREKAKHLVAKARLLNKQQSWAMSQKNRDLLERQTYFVTTAAGACLAYVLPAWKSGADSGVLVSIALLLWSVCFLFGFLHLDAMRTHMSLNAARLAGKDVPMSALEGKGKEGECYWHAMLGTFLAGVLAYGVAQAATKITGS